MYHGIVEAIRIETTIDQDGILQVPNLRAGERVEVIILRLPTQKSVVRKGGWIKGKITIHPGFDDPIPGMESCQ